MFTGLVETTGSVTAVEENDTGCRLTISAPGMAGPLTIGESVAVDGVCLTVADANGPTWTADVMRVTKETTTLGSASVGRRVNLERALRADSRMGGHFVQGHVDGIATLLSRVGGPEWDDLTFRLPEALTRYVVVKGSIAIDGVSLTVASLKGTDATVSLIPTTIEVTTLGERREDDVVNIEVDVIGKYIEKLVGGRE
ncbi:MAG: riboflavin synthase [Demequinaceae bacterium]|nr:riboflavin synthase [Demequinaceae bacterium]